MKIELSLFTVTTSNTLSLSRRTICILKVVELLLNMVIFFVIFIYLKEILFQNSDPELVQGFFSGIFDGFLLPYSYFGSLMYGDISAMAHSNTGGTYYFGVVLGILETINFHSKYLLGHNVYSILTITKGSYLTPSETEELF